MGLGFGLQEIVANFICGLIILFERPFAVGDIITVGETSGTVTRIRIRATTITNWDHQELIVPNKEFITGKLTNWSLSDPVMRIVIPVGIAYGSDTALAEEILMKAGVKRDDLVQTGVIAAHPGGTVRIGELLDKDCQTPIQNCYCMDTTIIPEPWGLPPTVTVVAMAKRLAKHLTVPAEAKVAAQEPA